MKHSYKDIFQDIDICLDINYVLHIFHNPFVCLNEAVFLPLLYSVQFCSHFALSLSKGVLVWLLQWTILDCFLCNISKGTLNMKRYFLVSFYKTPKELTWYPISIAFTKESIIVIVPIITISHPKEWHMSIWLDDPESKHCET